MDKGEKRLYDNLRRNFQNIVDEVLGEDYYTINPDHFGGDNESSEDIINKYRHINKELKLSKINNIILLLVVFILGYFIIILN